jgi:hypothetical protein
VGGEKLFVDYAGDTVPVIIDRLTGEIRDAQIFVAVRRPRRPDSRSIRWWHHERVSGPEHIEQAPTSGLLASLTLTPDTPSSAKAGARSFARRCLRARIERSWLPLQSTRMLWAAKVSGPTVSTAGSKGNNADIGASGLVRVGNAGLRSVWPPITPTDPGVPESR